MKPSEAVLGHYRQTYAWVLKNARKLECPVSYEHPSGAAVWVKLDAAVKKKVKVQLPKPR